MTRFLLLFVLPLFFIACKNSGGRQESEKQQTTRQDTFFTRDLSMEPNLPREILLDTIIRSNDKLNSRATIIIPSGLKKDFPDAWMKLDSFIKDKIDIIEDENDPDEQTYGSVDIHPLSLYKTDDVISYSFESYYRVSGMMRGFWNYCVINYDCVNRRFINIEDYFITNTADSLNPAKKMVNRVVGWDGAFDNRPANLPLKFSFDKENVYLYFDMFESINPIGIHHSISKKYIKDQLQQKYRDLDH